MKKKSEPNPYPKPNYYLLNIIKISNYNKISRCLKNKMMAISLKC